MSERYACWDAEGDEDPGESPSPRQVVEDYSVEGAAEEYAERCYNNSGEWVDSIAISVRDASGKVHVVDVTMEAVPSFTGSVRA